MAPSDIMVTNKCEALMRLFGELGKSLGVAHVNMKTAYQQLLRMAAYTRAPE